MLMGEDSVQGDLENPASLQAAYESVETLFHCAGYTHAFAFLSAELHWRINYTGTKKFDRSGRAGGRAPLCFLVQHQSHG